MWKILITYGIPRKIVSAIKKIYEHSRCVKTEDGYRYRFHVVTGVRQGRFSLPFSSVWTSTGSWGWQPDAKKGLLGLRRSFCQTWTLLMTFAALSDTTQGLQCLVESVGRYADGLGLVVSEKKTRNMLTVEHKLSTDVLISNNKDHELNCRMVKAPVAFKQLRKIWRTKNNLRSKHRFYDSNVLPTLLYNHTVQPYYTTILYNPSIQPYCTTLLYGCESWQPKQAKKTK